MVHLDYLGLLNTDHQRPGPVQMFLQGRESRARYVLDTLPPWIVDLLGQAPKRLGERRARWCPSGVVQSGDAGGALSRPGRGRIQSPSDRRGGSVSGDQSGLCALNHPSAHEPGWHAHTMSHRCHRQRGVPRSTEVPTGDASIASAWPGQAWCAKEPKDARDLSVHTVWDGVAGQKGRVAWAGLGRPGLRLQPLPVRLAAGRSDRWGGRRSAARQGPYGHRPGGLPHRAWGRGPADGGTLYAAGPGPGCGGKPGAAASARACHQRGGCLAWSMGAVRS